MAKFNQHEFYCQDAPFGILQGDIALLIQIHLTHIVNTFRCKVQF